MLIKDFLPGDQEKAQKEMDCIFYCSKQANIRFVNGNYEEAISYNENVNRSLRELEKLKQNKEKYDEVIRLHKGNPQAVLEKSVGR